MSDESAVETLTVQLAGLELTITARRLPGGDSGFASSTSFELVSSGAAQAETSVIDPADGFSLEWIERQALAATTAQQCADFARLLPFLDPLVAKLSASSGEWTPAARIGRAYRAGVLAGLRLSGRTSELDSLSVPFRNIYYVVLEALRECSLAGRTIIRSTFGRWVAPGRSSTIYPSARLFRATLKLRPFCPEPARDGHLEQSHAAVALVVYARQGGFMIAVPGKQELSSYIEELDQFGASEKPGFFEGTAALETTRGRALGEGSVLLVDLPWEMLAHFTYASVFKSASMTGVDVANWSVEGVAARPVKQSVRELADEWIASGMGELEAQDYLTGEELLDDPMQFNQPESQAAATQTSENAVLKMRIAELEAQLKAPPQLIQAVPKPASGPGRLSGLFAQSQAATLTDPEMVRLQRLAGVAPPRVAGAEPRRSVVPATTLQEDSLLVDLEREAQEPEEQITMAQLDPQQFQDPMQKLLSGATYMYTQVFTKIRILATFVMTSAAQNKKRCLLDFCPVFNLF
eukprot:symbB.v1.2.039927.t1/scaffold6870.1/size28492/3